MSHFPEYDSMSFPDIEVFGELAGFLEQWGSQHQEFLQQLKTGHSTLRDNWEGDGAVSYSTLHARTQDAGNQQVELIEQAVSGIKDVEEKTSVARALWIAAGAAIAIAVGLALFTFGASLIAAAAAVTLAVSATAIAVAAQIALFVVLLTLAINLPKANGGEVPLVIVPPPGITFPDPLPTNPPNSSMPYPIVPDFPLPVEPPNVPIQIGLITTPNPNLWLNLATMGSDNPQYIVGSKPPTIPGDWLSVNQFCSLMSAAWLINASHPADFTLTGNFTAAQINTMARILTDQDGGLQAQTDRAATTIGGQQQPESDAIANASEGGNYAPGTLIWAANDQHAIGITIDSATQFTLYDPNTGRATQYNRSDFENVLRNVLWQPGNIDFVVKQP